MRFGGDSPLSSDNRYKAVLFDLDGTLIPNYSAEWTLFTHVWRQRWLGKRNVLQLAFGLWNPHNRFNNILLGNKRYLRGKRLSELQECIHACFRPFIAELLFPALKKCIAYHRQQNDQLFIVSGSLQPIVDCFTEELGFVDGIGNKLEVRNGICTGKLAGIPPYGAGKVVAAKQLQQTYGFNRHQIIAYANEWSDRSLLAYAGSAVVVRPGLKLKKLAQTWHWHCIDSPHVQQSSQLWADSR